MPRADVMRIWTGTIETERRIGVLDQKIGCLFTLPGAARGQAVAPKSIEQAAAGMVEELAREAKERQLKRKSEDGEAGGRGNKTLGKELPKVSDEGKATQQAAKLVGTNRQYVADAKAIKQASPAIAEKVRAGEAAGRLPPILRELETKVGGQLVGSDHLDVPTVEEPRNDGLWNANFLR